MVTHIGGLDAVPETVLNLPAVSYTHLDVYKRQGLYGYTYLEDE